jgi:predicted AlkP superfamily pyrophosphatase or phosphodiesterase
MRIVVLSEYGITNVDTPIHLNRIFRQRGWLTVKEELGLEILDAGASKVFAVADHQIAHVYVNDPSLLASVRKTLEEQEGVQTVLGFEEKRAFGIDHARAGEHPARAHLSRELRSDAIPHRSRQTPRRVFHRPVKDCAASPNCRPKSASEHR